MNASLFETESPARYPKDILGSGTAVLSGFALDVEDELISSLKCVVERSPFHNMVTPGGFRMSVAMSNCGALGWITDRTGYRYDAIDPQIESFLACHASGISKARHICRRRSRLPSFVPDACLINRYEPGVRLSLHQDKDERDFTQPIVSVSLGLPAIFLFGGLERRDNTQRIQIIHGDVLVSGGPLGCAITVLHRCERVFIHKSAEFVTISHFGTLAKR